jgi:hypothetical protein
MSAKTPPPRVPRSLIVRLAQEDFARNGPPGMVEMPLCYEFFVRNYRPTTMGPTPGNDTNIFDDLWTWITPGGMLAINANTDPSRYGWNAGVGKPMAVLNPGWWPFYRGAHKGRKPSMRQYDVEQGRRAGLPNDGRFSVTRTYAPGDHRNYQESGYYAINQHDNRWAVGTTSEGCLTAHTELYLPFMTQVWSDSKKAKMDTIWCGLIEGPII